METLDICIPAFNEGPILKDTLTELVPYIQSLQLDHWKIIIVNNNSTDNTEEVVMSFSHPNVVLTTEQRRGKGAAVIAGARMSRADYFAYIDADLSAHPQHIQQLFASLKAGNDIATGSRLINPRLVQRSFWRTATARFFRMYAQLMVPVPVLDSQCGLKMMTRSGKEVLLSCKDKGWFFDREFLAKATKRDLKIAEIPVVWEEFHFPERKSKLNVFQVGLKSLYRLLIIRFNLIMFK